MTKIQINYDKEKFHDLLVQRYCSKVGTVPGTSKAVDTFCRKLTVWLYDGGRYNSLLIVGGVGMGKTTLMESLSDTLQLLAQHGIYSNLQALIKAPKLNNEARIQEGLIDYLAERKGLIIDDLGSEMPTVKIYGTELHPMEMLVKRRSDDELPTIITTNLSLEQIEQQYQSARIADVLAQYDRLTIANQKSFRRR